MEANKDESIKCFKIAKTAFSRQDYQKALKFANKANNMFPSQEYQTFIDKCLKFTQNTPNDTPINSNDLPNNSKDPPRKFFTTIIIINYIIMNLYNWRLMYNFVENESSSRNATEEQESLCRMIVKSKNYYEILQVAKTDSVEKIKKSYKKLALKLHPDKNPSPLASEAFKKVSTAFQCLTNPRAREEYDLHGDEERFVNQQRYQQDFVTPEQLFEAFFGIHQHNNVFHFTTRRTGGNRNNTRRGGLTQFVPLLVLMIFMLMMNLFSRSPQLYQFEKSSKFGQMQSTSLNGVVYYVDSRTFERTYPKNTAQRIKIEFEVEYKYFEDKCNDSKRENQRQIYSYLSSFRNPPPELYETPKSCKVLNDLRHSYTKLLQKYEF
ncbi:DnaJ-like molecular chaperone, putative [Theileria annulata]|uniref:DnaJ-like molecular chaperone, putative n=1 Tax=Theileria annulata TaxID=5874 RepID=Q4UIZ7_THEAN|nr:DnaJ-like molecular chaperone, putative [Theileria annulata]CAI72942.1 DnaJ-like molecular chaperone, putative [Theileria annulata]|eukprot:XP_953620.1 DnaJ-like molecular chaperone, putative [Theileria annulata]